MGTRRTSTLSGQDLYKRAKQLIPGGTQLLSKRPELFLPDQWPAYYSKCKGAYVWDLKGHRYTDMTNHGIGTCILGYNDPDVAKAVQKAVRAGSMCTLNCPEEVELAELLCELHPWAEQVRYSRCGGEAMAIAVRIARAATGREAIAFCGYHGWHDWYLSANLANDNNLDGQLLPGLEPLGVPRGLAGTVQPFHYNNREELGQIISTQGHRLAAIVMEPARSGPPDAEFLRYVRAAADRIGAVLIFDEVTSGWRQELGGIHLATGVNPDMAVFAKGISNGYAMAAIIGKATVMRAVQTTFISSTYWTERIGPTAALATIRKMKKYKVAKHVVLMGKKVQEGWATIAKRYAISIHIDGIYPLSHFSFDGDGDLSCKTLFTQLMLEKGYLAATTFYSTFAHTPEIIAHYLKTVNSVFGIIHQAIEQGTVKQWLKGPLAHAGFKRLN